MPIFYTYQMTSKLKNYFKKLGIVGFLFFLGKGIVWLIIFYFVKKKL